MNAASLLVLENIAYTYPDGTQALQQLNLSLNKGEKIAFVGANGAGKSTLFQILNGIIKPQQGQYYFNGELVSFSRKALFELRQKVGVVFQDPDNQIFSSNVLEEVSFGPMNMKLTKTAVRMRVEKAMEQTGVSAFANKPAHLLSFGQKKRVNIASVLSMEPMVLVLDEPTSGLDPLHANRMMCLFNELSRQGKTLLLSTHDVNLAYDWADRVVVMKSGSILAVGSPKTIFTDGVLMAKAGLEKPLLLNVYEKLQQLGFEGDVPATLDELYACLEVRV